MLVVCVTCSWCVLAYGLLMLVVCVACSWFACSVLVAFARGACDVLVVCVACSWCVRARGLLMLVVSFFVFTRGGELCTRDQFIFRCNI